MLDYRMLPYQNSVYDLWLLLLEAVIGEVIKEGNKPARQGEIAHLYFG